MNCVECGTQLRQALTEVWICAKDQGGCGQRYGQASLVLWEVDPQRPELRLPDDMLGDSSQELKNI